MKEENTDPAVKGPSKPELDKKETFIDKPFLVEAEKMFDRLAEISRETAKKAYEFFLDRGGDFGKEIDDWFKAENEVLRFVPVRVTEANGTVSVRADVPGFKPEEIEISVKDDLLMISGKTEEHIEKKDENVVYTDFKSNRFFRQMILPSPVNADNVEAQLKDGILNISLPKATVADEPKKIAIKAA